MLAPPEIQKRITQEQRFICHLRKYHGCVAVPRLRAHYRWIARWWELEAMRGYDSADLSRQYAANYRWLVEIMDAGRRVTADANGVYIDGELASAVQARAKRAECKRRERETTLLRSGVDRSAGRR